MTSRELLERFSDRSDRGSKRGSVRNVTNFEYEVGPFVPEGVDESDVVSGAASFVNGAAEMEIDPSVLERCE